MPSRHSINTGNFCCCCLFHATECLWCNLVSTVCVSIEASELVGSHQAPSLWSREPLMSVIQSNRALVHSPNTKASLVTVQGVYSLAVIVLSMVCYYDQIRSYKVICLAYCAQTQPAELPHAPEAPLISHCQTNVHVCAGGGFVLWPK